MYKFIQLSIIFFTGLLVACTVGPDYVRPPMEVPLRYSEAPKGWKIADPQDLCDRGPWWTIFKDPELNSLEDQLNLANQTIANADANYRQALALIGEANAAFFPTVVGGATYSRHRQSSSGQTSINNSSTNNNTSTNSTTSTSSQGRVANTYSVLLNTTWEPDIWGQVRRSVEASIAGAQASQALLAATRLSMQASLAQIYFELRTADADQQLLDNTVKAYQKALDLTMNRYNAGVAGRTDVAQAQTQLETARSEAIHNRINRAQLEHAIAVLVGELPENFSLAFQPLNANPPPIPMEIPASLLERRPDIAQAERLVAQANAQIGVAVSAYYPNITLTADGDVQNNLFNKLFTLPSFAWSLGAQGMETLFDGGLRNATLAAATAEYEATVASYRQTVLTTFQDVEDNLASLVLLKQQVVAQEKAAKSAELALKLITNQYKAGTAAYTDVIVAQNLAYTAEKDAIDIHGLEMTSAVGLIKALGGGWDAIALNVVGG